MTDSRPPFEEVIPSHDLPPKADHCQSAYMVDDDRHVCDRDPSHRGIHRCRCGVLWDSSQEDRTVTRPPVRFNADLDVKYDR